jgi:hypothetical protein
MDNFNIGDYLIIDGIPAKEYYRDKPIDYKSNVSLFSGQQFEDGCYLNKDILCDAAAVVGSSSFFNPYFKVEQYISGLGYSIISNDSCLTGAAIFYLNRCV